jgi:hypothetical protein
VRFAGLGASLATNVHQTLKFLALSITVRDIYYPLCGLGRELRFIAGNNILEELELDMVVDAVFIRTESEDWSAFDSVLTESGAFPMLHRVSISAKIWPEDLDEEHDWWCLESLMEDKFPRLAESKAVKFNFSVEILY